ncbi:MAG: hypothetical protein AMXMBFR84_38240 [Candidatus Hydrogenedentota bacterium]
MRQQLPIFVLVVCMSFALCAEQTSEPPASELTGTWMVTAATNSFVIVIKPDGKAVVLLIQDGSHGIDNVTWKPMPGGLLIEGLPRFRFWNGRNAAEARVEMEALPFELMESSLQRFPTAFFMKRYDEGRNLGGQGASRPLAAGWDRETLPADWDEKAGQWREVPPKTQ